MSANKVRELVVAQIVGGKSQAEVSRDMGIPLGTVKSHWRLYKVRGSTDNPSCGGSARKVRTNDLINDVKDEIDDDPEISIRELARRFDVDEKTMRKVVKKDLRLKSLAVVKAQQLTPAQREGRRVKGAVILSRLKNEVKGKILVFSDEKDFHIDKHVNRRNQRVIAESASAIARSDRFVGRSKFPAKAMLFGFVGSDGTAFPPVWIKGTMDAVQYKNILIRKVFPVLDATYGVGNYIWTQDGASCHTAN